MPYRKVSALVAGDSVASRSVLASLLLGLGVGDVRQAHDGGEAFRQIRARTPDFLVLDFELDRDAIATLEHIRTAPDSPRHDLPIAIVVAFVTKSGIEALKQAGVSSVLLKPTAMRQLTACVQALLNDRRPFVASATYSGPDRRSATPSAYTGPERRGGDADDDLLMIDIG